MEKKKLQVKAVQLTEDLWAALLRGAPKKYTLADFPGYKGAHEAV